MIGIQSTSSAWEADDRVACTPAGRRSLQLVPAYGDRWLAMVESGKSKSLKEIAKREGADTAMWMVNLTTLPAQLTLIDPSGRTAGTDGGATEPN